MEPNFFFESLNRWEPQEGTVEKYLIRITSKPGATLQPDLILTSDYAAGHHGRVMAAPGEKLEVWRDGECIFMSEDLGLPIASKQKYPGAFPVHGKR